MAAMALPGTHAPAAGFDQPFGLLDACHDRVRRSLALLQRLVGHLPGAGVDAAARDAARDVLRYFSIAAPAHHDDEERHVVPALRSTGEPRAIAAAEQLLAEHVLIRAAWRRLAPLLERVVAGADPGQAALAAAAAEFAALHDGHLVLEDGTAFPLAAQVLALRGEQALHAMGAEMAARRGVAVEPAQQGGTSPA